MEVGLRFPTSVCGDGDLSPPRPRAVAGCWLPITCACGLVRARVADVRQMVNHPSRPLEGVVRSRVSLYRIQVLQRYAIC